MYIDVNFFIHSQTFLRRRFVGSFFIDLVCVCIIINRFIKIKAAAAFFKKSQWIVDH